MTKPTKNQEETSSSVLQTKSRRKYSRRGRQQRVPSMIWTAVAISLRATLMSHGDRHRIISLLNQVLLTTQNHSDYVRPREAASCVQFSHAIEFLCRAR